MKCRLADVNEIKEGSWSEYNLETKNSFVSIILHKKDHKLMAYKNFCPHQGRRLDYINGKFLIDENGHIICPAHGAEFLPLTGECVNGPCKGQSLESIELSVESESVYAIVEK